MRQLAAQLPHALFSLFYPDDCRVCSAPLLRFSRVPVCGACLDDLKPLEPGAQCAQCGLPLASEVVLEGSGLCGECRLGPAQFDWARGYGDYEGVLRHLIHLFKYAGMRPLAQPLGERLATLLAKAGPVDLIVPVPLDRRRRRSRGFNQAELLAETLGRLSAIPVDGGALRRHRPTPTQTGLSREQRRLNVKGAFQARRPERLAGKYVALVDDVITTGATAGACAEVLKRAGAARVVVLALARARLRMEEPAPVPAPADLPPLTREASCGAA